MAYAVDSPGRGEGTGAMQLPAMSNALPNDRLNRPPNFGAADADVDAMPLHGKVLYIEDTPTNVALVKAMLVRHPGIELIHAATGYEGIRLVRSERPDFVLLYGKLDSRVLFSDGIPHRVRLS